MHDFQLTLSSPFSLGNVAELLRGAEVEFNRPLTHRAHDGYRRVGTEALLMLLQRSLKVLAFTDPRAISARLAADDLLPIDIEPVDLVGVRKACLPVDTLSGSSR